MARKMRRNEAPKKGAFVTHLGKTGNITVAARRTGIARATYYRWIKRDEEFRQRCEDAVEDYAEALEAEADRRAVEGVEEPIYRAGRLVGYQRRVRLQQK